MNKLLVIGFGIVLCTVSNALAAVTVDDLYIACSNRSKNVSAELLCTEYLAGFLDGMISQSVMSNEHLVFCPNQLEVRQMGSLFIKGVDGDPKLREAPDAGIAMAVILKKQFPCNEKKL